MAREIIDLPPIFHPQLSNWIIDVRGKSGSEGVTGTGQTRYGSQPRWMVDLDFNAYQTNLVLSWRAIVARLRGRQNVLRVPINDRHRATLASMGVPVEDIAQVCTGTPFSDGAFFDDGSGFALNPTIVANASLSAGVKSFTAGTSSTGDKLQAGQWVSYEDWPYLIEANYPAGPGLYTYEFEPALRRAVPAGGEFRLHATCLMVVSGDLDGRMSLNYNKLGNVSISLTEWTGDDGDPR
jgi:hypothetical protein